MTKTYPDMGNIGIEPFFHLPNPNSSPNPQYCPLPLMPRRKAVPEPEEEPEVLTPEEVIDTLDVEGYIDDDDGKLIVKVPRRVKTEEIVKKNITPYVIGIGLILLLVIGYVIWKSMIQKGSAIDENNNPTGNS